MHRQPCLMINLESINHPIGKRACKDIIPPSGLMCAIGSTCVVARWTTPLVCLSSNINEGVGVQSLLEAGEGGWVTIEIPNYQHWASGLQGDITEDSLDQ